MGRGVLVVLRHCAIRILLGETKLLILLLHYVLLLIEVGGLILTSLLKGVILNLREIRFSIG